MNKTGFLAAASLAALAIATPAAAQDASAASKAADQDNDAVIKMSMGVDYSQGDYGDTIPTKVTAVPVSVRYSKRGFTFKVSTSFVKITGPGSLLTTPEDRIGRTASSGRSGSSNSGPGSANSGSGSSNSGSGSSNSGSGSGSNGSGSSGGGSSGSSGSGSSGSGSGSSGSGSAGSSSSGSNSSGSGSISSPVTSISAGTVIPGGANRKDSGIGDTSVSLSYSYDFGKNFYLDLTGKVKIPTASKAKRLGTGKVDFVASAELSKAMGAVDLYVGGRRKFAGKGPTLAIRDTWGISAGAGVRIARGVRLGLDYDWQQASFVAGQGSSEVTGSINIRLNDRINLNLYGTAGLNQSSVDAGAGAQLSYRF